MAKRIYFASLIFWILLSLSSLVSIKAKDKNEIFPEAVRQTFNFDPQILTREEARRKAVEIEQFIKVIQSDPETYLPLLREELKKDPGGNSFSKVGSLILMSLSDSKEDLQLILDTIRRCDFRGTDRSVYFHMVHYIGRQGLNTWPAIERILEDPEFVAFIADGYPPLDRTSSVVLCLLVLDENQYLDRVIQRLETEVDPQIIKILLTALAYTVTEKGQDTINSYLEGPRFEELISGEQNRLLDEKRYRSQGRLTGDQPFSNWQSTQDWGNEEITHDFRAGFSALELHSPITWQEYGKLKELRRKKAERLGTQTLSEIDYLTELMLAAFHSPKEFLRERRD